MNFISEVCQVDGDNTQITLMVNDEPVASLFAIVSLDATGTGIVDNCYCSIEEAQHYS
jgi:hypothetical protein